MSVQNSLPKFYGALQNRKLIRVSTENVCIVRPPYIHGSRRHLLCTAAARHGLNQLHIVTFMIVLVQFLEQITLLLQLMLQSTNGSHDDQILINNRKVEEYCLVGCEKLFTETTQYHTPEYSSLTHTIPSYESHIPHHTKSLQ